MALGLCTVDGCEKKERARGLCRKHYLEAKNRGDFPSKICSVEGCDRPVEAKGYCSKHYKRYKIYGSPLVKRKKFNLYVDKGDYVEVVLFDRYGDESGRALIDHDKVEIVAPHKWYRDGERYAAAMIKGKHTKMHQVLCPTYSLTDHKTGNTMDNRIQNLRECTYSQNKQNAKPSTLNTSGVTGVSWNKSKKRWVTYITPEKGSRKWLGVFNTFKEAVECRQKAEKEHFGEFAFSAREAS